MEVSCILQQIMNLQNDCLSEFDFMALIQLSTDFTQMEMKTKCNFKMLLLVLQSCELQFQSHCIVLHTLYNVLEQLFGSWGTASHHEGLLAMFVNS